MLLSLALAAALAASPDTVPGAIRGSVQSEPAGVPLHMAVVEVAAGSRVLDTTTDSTGAYRIGRVPAGRRLLRVRALDHAPLELEVLVPAGGEVVLDFALRPRPIALDTVVARLPVAGGAVDTAVASHGDVALVNARALDSGSPVASAGLGGGGGSGGGGGQEPGDTRDVLYVRGSAADLKLVLLDGAPVYAPFHQGGLIHTFDPEALGGARLYLGGAPARYDGGLSYVLDMRTRAGRGERHHLSGSADMVSGRALAEGPLARGATYLAAARGVHGAILSRMEGEPFPYAYREGLARVDVPLRGGSEVGLTLFANREGVRVDSVGGMDEFAHWSNTAASLRWRGSVRGTGAEMTAALTGFRAHLPWRDAHALVMGAGIRRARVALDLSRDWGGARLRYGASYDRTHVDHDVRLDEVEGEPLRLTSGSAGDAGGVYVDVAWQPRPRFALRAGLRGDVFSVGGTYSLSPRLSATWLLSDRAALTLAAGRYHQYLRQRGTRVRPGGTLDSVSAPTTANLAERLDLGTELSVSRATHVALAVDQQVGQGVRLGMEGYFKHFEALDRYDGDPAFNSGVDVWVRGGEEGPVSGWLGYSLAWSWAEGDGPDRFAGRHLLSAGLAGTVRRARFGLRVAYGAGLPYTAVYAVDNPAPVGEGPLSVTGQPQTGGTGSLDSDRASDAPPLSSTPNEPYVRVDAELSRTWTSRWAGRTAELTPYLRVLNALDRRDALFYRYDQAGGGTRSVATLPILPVAGVTFRF